MFGFFGPVPPVARQNNALDILVIHAKIWTDGHLMTANQLGVKDGKIVAIGSGLESQKTPSTRVIDANGHWVLPGIIDCHTHIVESCVKFAFGLKLESVTSKSEFQKKISDQAKLLSPGQWILGGGWSADRFHSKEPPSKVWIDAVSGDHPAALTRMDGHSILLNSAALKLSGITKDGPPDPDGGRIERDPITHEPTGILADRALSFVRTPQPSSKDYDKALLLTIDGAHRQGVTTSGDIVRRPLDAVWRKYMERPDRNFRVAMFCRVTDVNSVRAVRNIPGIPGWFEPRGIKLFMDGSMGSRSAFMDDPYTTPLPSQPKDWRGLEYPGARNGAYKEMIDAAAEEHLQVVSHAIGDRSNHDILEMYSHVDGLKSRRFRVEHAQHLRPADIARFGELGVIPSMQPFHKSDDGPYVESVIGSVRAKSSYAFRSLLNSGAKLVFGSDFDVVTLNPWVGIATAVTGRISNGKVWMPEQNISLDQALSAYTCDAAYSMFMENEVGSLQPGHLADFIILDRALKPDGSNVSGAKPVRVFVGGKEVSVPNKQ